MTIQNIASQNKTASDEKIQAGVGQYYKNKYPGKIEKKADAETVEPMSVEERQESDRAFSDGIFFANKQNNSDILAKLKDVFAGRNKGAK